MDSTSDDRIKNKKGLSPLEAIMTIAAFVALAAIILN